MKKKVIHAILLISASLLIALFVGLKSTSTQIFPFGDNKGVYLFDSYRENSEEHSNPQTRWLKTPSGESLSLSYKLSTDTAVFRAFAGLTIFKADTLLDLFDFSKYNSLSIDLESRRGKQIPFLLYMHFERNVHDDGKFVLNVPLTYMIEYEGRKTYNIPFDEFEIPDWWVTSKGIKKEELSSFDFSKITLIIIESCYVLDRGHEDKITVRSLALHDEYRWLYLSIGIPISLILLVLGLLKIITKKERKTKLLKLLKRSNERLKRQNGSSPTIMLMLSYTSMTCLREHIFQQIS